MFKDIFKKHKIKVFMITPIIIVLSLFASYIYSYTFKPRVFSPDWFSSRYAGWEAEQHDLWVATVIDVMSPKTIKVVDVNEQEKIMDLLYLNTLNSSPKMNNFYAENLSQYIGQQLFIKGNPDKSHFSGVLIDGNGENINLNLTYVPGAVLDMSSTAYIHEREKQLVPYFANLNAENRNF